ncbi:MAG: metal ABC transporter permease [Muribaculaceae bacterium]|nr:metal ABC transporter permease [Muribaculaceae bacterium]
MEQLFQYQFFRNALLGVAIISIAAGIIGTYIVTRRLVAISGGITHACFGGLGLGYFMGWNPIGTAAVFAILSSLGVEWMSTRTRVREDSAIAVVWALGMAVGVLFVFLTPGYVPELNSFLFGNILTISVADLWTFGIYTIVLIAIISLWFRRIVLCAFDRDFAIVSGLNVRLVNSVMTIMVAVCIVLTIRLVGIMLLMSMITLPQLTAENFCSRFRPMMLSSIIISIVSCISGLMLATVINVPCSAIIVILQITVYAAALLIARNTTQHSRRA